MDPSVNLSLIPTKMHTYSTNQIFGFSQSTNSLSIRGSEVLQLFRSLRTKRAKTVRQVLCHFLGFYSISHPPNQPWYFLQFSQGDSGFRFGFGSELPTCPSPQKGWGMQRTWFRKMGLTLASCQSHSGSILNEPEAWVLFPEILMYLSSLVDSCLHPVENHLSWCWHWFWVGPEKCLGYCCVTCWEWGL